MGVFCFFTLPLYFLLNNGEIYVATAVYRNGLFPDVTTLISKLSPASTPPVTETVNAVAAVLGESVTGILAGVVGVCATLFM